MFMSSLQVETVAQVILRWHLERGIIIILKSSNLKMIPREIGIFGDDVYVDQKDTRQMNDKVFKK